jgi:NADH-quinone oxidoreductase subunit M
MPVWSTFMVFFVMASVGLPGLNGFISEFLCLLGAFQASSAWGSGVWGTLGASVPGATGGSLGPWYAAIAGTGMIVAAMYLLYMVGKVVWGPLVEPGGHGDGHGHGARGDAHGPLPRDLSGREIGILVPLAVLCLVLGLYPKLLTDALEKPVGGTISTIEGARRASTLVPSIRPDVVRDREGRP